MIKYLYATKNKKSGNFNNITAYDFPKENAAEVFSISAKESPKEARVDELEVYSIGTYDTCTGVVKSEVEFLIDLGAVVSEVGKQEAKS